MAGGNFKAALQEWVNDKITVINPASYRKGTITEGVALETYEATLVAIEEDFIRVSFEAQKKDSREKVVQLIPLHEVKRISIWGTEKFLQL